MSVPAIKSSHKAIQKYHETLHSFRQQEVEHEGATRFAFQTLLHETCRTHGWVLIPEERTKVGGKTVIPDGTLRDLFNLHRGFWEAKDTSDDLSVEIQKKTKLGYPLTNTIFEDTEKAVLFQGKKQVFEADLTDKQQVADLLNQFYEYHEPEHEDFEQAVTEFQERVPDLAKGLADRIAGAHKDNPKFQTAFAAFFDLCKASLNPNLSQSAVDEMLVQHLLTERLFRTIFKNQDFTRKNVIAAEVEKVIDALVSKSFDRADFLKKLDRFYVAIENAAETLPEFSDKQHFLNTVYERFFQGYSVKVADTHGIVYTPQPIVDFMCASVAEVLQNEFGKKLGDKDVNILDPCTGTGNFIVNLLKRIPKKDLPRMYRDQLFANEVMLLPYYIAALNIEHAYFELTNTYESFEGLCFVDTLELAEDTGMFSFMTEKNTERVERQKKSPITVIIGNPPYNMGQLNENDNNKNRSYGEIDDSIASTYAKDSSATLRRQLYDPYVRFFLWATERLQGKDGIVCYVSNNSFVDQRAFDGMRKHLLNSFTKIYHLHLEGNVRHNPKLAGTTYNVFGIQVGVGITVAIRCRKRQGIENARLHSKLALSANNLGTLSFHRIDKNLRRENKLALLTEYGSIHGLEWEILPPDKNNNWLPVGHGSEFDSYSSIGNKLAKATSVNVSNALFKSYGRGVATNADSYVYDFDRKALIRRARTIVEDFNSQLDRWKRKGSPKELDSILVVDEKVHKWIRYTKRALHGGNHVDFHDSAIRTALYRPFCKRSYYFERWFNEDTYQFPRIFPTPNSEAENIAIGVTDAGSERPFMTLAIQNIADMHVVGAGSAIQCFPFYVYDEDGSHRRENITDWALEQFQKRYGKSRDSEPSRDREGAGNSDTSLVSAPLANARGSELGERHSDALAYFLTFHTYGTWLHGRVDGSVDRKHNTPGTPVLDADVAREQAEFLRLKVKPIKLNARMRGVVEKTVREVCEHRGWMLSALNVRTNHVHIVVSGEAKPEKMMNDFKAYATRRLVEAGLVEAKTKLWSRHGSTLYLWTEDAVAAKCQYVREEQGVELASESIDLSRDREGAVQGAARVTKPLTNVRGSAKSVRGSDTEASASDRHGDITKWDIFYYVYGLLHHPGYRTKFADNLKRELPRIPLAPDFWAFATAGKQLAKLHLEYEELEPYPLKWIETPGEPLDYRVEKMKLSKDKTSLIINRSLTVAALPGECFEYRLGNRSALEWVIDQYQVSEDKRSGIQSDPNRVDDPEYIVRLVGQVVRVSVETVKIVKGLPAEYA